MYPGHVRLAAREATSRRVQISTPGLITLDKRSMIRCESGGSLVPVERITQTIRSKFKQSLVIASTMRSAVFDLYKCWGQTHAQPSSVGSLVHNQHRKDGLQSTLPIEQQLYLRLYASKQFNSIAAP